MNVFIRKGTRADLPGVIELIKELADYEKAPGEVAVTVERMEQDAFGENPCFDFFVAAIDNKIVGTAIYYTKYSTWKGRCIFLEDLIVTLDYRNKGIGLLLFDAVAFLAKGLAMNRLEWQVLEWNLPAIGFYKKLNANFDAEWINCKLSKEQLSRYKEVV